MTFDTFPPAAAALPDAPRSALRERVTAATRPPEPACVPPLVAEAQIAPALQKRIHDLACRLVRGLRAKRRRSSGVDALMKEFSLSSQEGVALMCLAEALLRVPDRATADRLIRDKLARGDWRGHLGHSPSLFVNAATWGLLVTGRIVATRGEEGLASALQKVVARGGEPLIRKGMDLAMRLLGEQFVTGRTIEEALERGREPESRGYRYSFDMLGEAAMTAADAQRYYEAYEHAIHSIGNASAQRGVVDGNGISVKLSALHPRYTWSQRDRVVGELLPRLRALCALARGYDIGLNIDAEEADRLELSLDLLEALVRDAGLDGWDGLGFVVQAYQKRAPFVIDWLVDLARRRGRRLMVRLVKGAYWDTEIKRAQIDGLAGYPVYTRKIYTDVCYLACAKKLLAARDALYPQFATHNAHTLAAVMHLADGNYRRGDYEFQCLHGMGEPLYDQIVGDPALRRLVRIYAPVGTHETLLAYLVRRLLENGANTSFVNRIVDERVPVDELIADPVAAGEPLAGAPHPRIPLPADLYGLARRNSAGYDLVSEPVRRALAEALQASRATRHRAVPMVAGSTGETGEPQAITNPADASDIVGEVVDADAEVVAAALGAAEAFAAEWAAVRPARRADLLERASDLLERDASLLIALAVREAGKSWANAVGEVREAVDFCRYYAAQARLFDNTSHIPLGPVVCISPWNFPLAIFAGQVAAALVAGNPVLAKPAEQTPLIAALAVRLFHEAGVPEAALQLLTGRGEEVGAALVADPRVHGVMFTGSTEVACGINRTLATRTEDVALIAETGGQNAMIVDSTALPEQVVADVLASAFDSAGQRCSALRVLCLQDDVADHLLTMLKGAMRELAVGCTVDVRTDVGPVIDAGAQAGLERHVEERRRAGERIDRLELPEGSARGTFVAPTIIEIAHIAELEREVFGPVLHVLRYRAGDLRRLVDDINATGYGLTLGIHSRIDETIDEIVARAHVGNIYVNRNIIGAVVGVQPFGGERRSGTGPKAGGPLYLHRLLRRGPGPDFARRGSATGDGSAFDACVHWLDGTACAELDRDEAAALFAHAETYRSCSMTGLRLTLAGATGEDNSLSFVPRGTLAGIAESTAGVLHQILAALATGNRIVFGDDEPVRMLRTVLPPLVAAKVGIDADWATGSFAALLFDGPGASAHEWRRRLAARDGPILPLVRPQPIYDPFRLVVERSLSINTAAAGGNASLMAMGT
ncbi:MAG: trifunctional transcriptional regulator/proline dehydrogenase/L-glutamate gamma-semialdehyde dehydrogenase [Aromatoleum sp.]|jgi:RHH-type proline utilization regulon transcriptional repressor/proline dehydrogenase/delta 1-pyrroline-5-carboxylate dehydrogenase|uniref:trifunctional transcriptional regulator/proline dehydrogenase/L-glutamate gamma-semialdehyde dehydrogenase n=1 Tax=Aromatoleum sp. TaxID=2307007 RepID=UPI0028948DCE|nr:trifunctional transcriptional regulator/proline dehydrogenase/L-glutamate gamma-semialdehyde dehydrogenase [Aromatoleum sp.]MDT3668848.1 trifunctional transcriptional regulator/proline dehydrogenase/L-glutamate gamma-semialdehyde dehydrogenase [Aromatoleum sp.]